MTSEKARTAIIIGVIALVVVLVVGGLTIFLLKVHAQTVKARALAELKESNPVEYYVQHTPMTMNEGDLRNAMIGKWRLAGAKSRQSGDFVLLQPGNNFFKTFTATNWAIATYDWTSNLLYSASGHYTLQGENYTESIEEATGMMTRYLGAHPKFKIRMDGDTYYQMGAGKNPSIEEMWVRVE